MRSKFLSSLAVSLALVLPALAADSAAKPAASTPVPKKMPTLLTDDSPVSQGVRPGLVASYADVIEPVQKAVVSVYSTKIVRQRINPFYRQLFGDQVPPDREEKERGLGSGVVISPDGYILTNNHVVEGADELNVLLTDERELKAKVIGADPKTDIAVIKIEAENLPVATLADSDKLRVGDVVFAIGNPLEVGQTVTMGIVSAKNRRSVHILDDVQGYQDFIQTDAAINMGNSGGALIDAKGRLVGINSAILSPSSGNIGIGFSVPINLASSIMRSLIETGTVARGYLGISQPSPITDDLAEQLDLPKGSKGVVVSDVVPDSPAEKAGLKRMDFISSINDRAITSPEDLRFTIAQMSPGSVARLRIVRDGKEKVMEITLGKLTENPNALFTGVNVEPLTDEKRRSLGISRRVGGLIVTEVAEDSPFRDNFTPNMIISEINRQPATDLATARSLLNPGRNLLAVYDQGSFRILVITVQH
ncbi:MAG TPA: Do family serine endopeptidase [Opitutaceae bacterium]|nr:Do family serine endopeptidase [Opitutaceae bacterium]